MPSYEDIFLGQPMQNLPETCLRQRLSSNLIANGVWGHKARGGKLLITRPPIKSRLACPSVCSLKHEQAPMTPMFFESPKLPSPSSMSQSFTYYANRVHDLLQTQLETCPEVLAALADLQTAYPYPPTEIVPPELWGNAKPKLRVNTHFSTELLKALNNIKNARHEVCIDKQAIQRILTHPCGWSATDPGHWGDPWVQYLQAMYSQIPNLQPILDSLIWPEELARYPIGCHPAEPSLFLLANQHSYYIFDLNSSGLFRAGATLTEVYRGLKECRWVGDKDGDWIGEDWSRMDLDERDYFPVYGYLNDDGSLQLPYPVLKLSTISSDFDGMEAPTDNRGYKQVSILNRESS